MGRRPERDSAERASALAALAETVVSCRACPRLVAWREGAAASPRASFAAERYWARPLAGFGDPGARLLVVGLAPAAHGGNRTGRMFTGDRSGDFLFAALHRAGFANQASSVRAGDDLELTGAWVTAAVRCAPPQNRPNPEEQRTCAPYLVEELRLLDEVVVVVALGAFAFDAIGSIGLLPPPQPASGGRRVRRPRFAHGLELELTPSGDAPRSLLCTYHPSQRNVFTGLLNETMIDAVFARARSLIDASPLS